MADKELARLRESVVDAFRELNLQESGRKVLAALDELERLRQERHEQAKQAGQALRFVGWLADEIPDWHTAKRMHEEAREFLGMTDDDGAR